jgi:hypothetical protein
VSGFAHDGEAGRKDREGALGKDQGFG